MAYTAFGGDTLPVEVTYYKGTGKVVLTGKLGDVMKESAMTALSFVKANSDLFKLDADLFKNNDFLFMYLKEQFQKMVHLPGLL